MRKKKFMVVPRTTQAREEGIVTSRGERKFSRGAFFVSEPSEAEEIDSRYGLKGKKGDVWVHEDPVYEWSLHHDMSVKGHNILTHRNTFSGVDTSHFKVWVVRNGKLTRVTKEQAKRNGYEIVSDSKKRPEVKHAAA